MIESTEKFGKYRLVERLASGGMAEIFKARVEGLEGFEKVVAIKRLHRQFSEDREFATMLSDEARLAVQLNHPNIGEVFDLGCIDGRYFIVMEFIDGLDLHRLSKIVRRQNRTVPLEVVVHVVARVAGALHYAHTKTGGDGRPLEIVHRDVSPQNIMISVDGVVKLVDFGIAKARMRAQHTRTGIIKGKFYYMSPEQAHGNPVDPRTDIYALGMVLYETLTGGHPFEKVDDAELLRCVRSADFPPVAQVRHDLPGELVDIVDRALSRDVARRTETARQLQWELEQFADANFSRFERFELAEFVRKYTDKHLPEKTRAAGFEAMGSDEYRATEDSVIFEAGTNPRQGSDDFEGDETQIFIRDEGESSGSDGHTAGERGSDRDRQAERDRSRQWAQRISADDSETGDVFEEESRRYDEEQTGYGPRKNDEERRTTAQVHRRILTAMFSRFEYLLRRRPQLVGGGLAAIAVVILVVSALLVWGPGGDEVAEDDGQATIASGSEDGVDDDHEVSVSVTTRPANARIFRDDVAVGSTPDVLHGLEVGTHYVLRFEKEGYEPEELNLLVEPDMPPLLVRLEPLGGIVRVVTEPEGIEVFIDDQSHGPAPVTVMGLDRESIHHVEARRNDEDRQSEKVLWSDGEERIKELSFEFEVDQSPRRQARSSRRATRSAQRTSSRASSRSAAPTTREDSSGGAIDIWGIAEEEEEGRLNVRVHGDEGRIYIDGVLVKDDTVLVGHTLTPGTYEVKVYFPSRQSYSESRTVRVRAGETSTVRFSP